ncbi:MAG: corrinoid ABC transporter substrate-binding protein [Pelotomaculum sp. PtaB.Bin104]|nr:MAG: corrinoid ABC transporter substrate-binding protein [Pelotomaculum sp. PtaB.Bin104]
MKSYAKKISILILIVVLLSLLCSCGGQTDTVKTIRVTDCVGRSIDVPDQPQSIATLDPFAGQAVIMYGAGDRMTATVGGVKRDLLLQRVCPSLAAAAVVKEEGSVNAEAVMAMGIDLMFIKSDLYYSNIEREKLDALGIPYLVIEYSSIESQRAAFAVIGEALGQTEKAEVMEDYYQGVVEKVSQRVSEIPQPARPSLYHSTSEALRTDTEGSLGAEWVGFTGVKNVSLGGELVFNEKNYYTTLEQIFVWDPDVIICNESGVADYMLNSKKWQGLRAVQEGRVYQVPIGASRWGHDSSVETPLAILWLAKTLYPDSFADVDLRSEMDWFYKTFYQYDLTGAEADLILSGKGIRSPGVGVSAEQ